MNHAIASALLSGCIGATAWCAWGIVCVERTGRHRQRILDWMFHSGEWWRLLPAYRAVAFEDHERALMLFRDPWKLYPPEFEAAR